MKILILNGPNLNLLGARETEVYGTRSLDEIVADTAALAAARGAVVEHRQSNEEGRLVSLIQESRGVYDGIIFNPGAYTHTSVALLDTLRACECPCIEVHLSNIHAREPFRRRSLTARACRGQISGLGPLGYRLALLALLELLSADSGKGALS